MQDLLDSLFKKNKNTVVVKLCNPFKIDCGIQAFTVSEIMIEQFEY